MHARALVLSCARAQIAASAKGQDLDPHDVLFADLVAHSKNDAAAQEGLVGIISDVLEWYVLWLCG